MRAIPKNNRLLLTVIFLTTTVGVQQLQAQTVIPNADTGSIVTPSGNRLDISGGKLSGDGANLFHSFKEFGLSQSQTANFLSHPSIQNILAGVTGGNASIINGLIQVSGGNSNLYLMNPSGIVFGPNASLNVPAAFTATTATGIGFGSNWFNAAGVNNYDALGGSPSSFAFNTVQAGAIIHTGSLSVPQGNLTLLGGTVAITGQLSAPSGQITVAAVPGEKLVRIRQQGMLLGLDVQPLATATNQPTHWTLPVLSLPQLLTAPGVSNATGLEVNGGQVELVGSGIQVENGDVVMGGAGVTTRNNRNLYASITAQTATLLAAQDLKLVSYYSSAYDSSGLFFTSYGSQLTINGELHLQAQRDLNWGQDRGDSIRLDSGGNVQLQAGRNLNIPSYTELSPDGSLSLKAQGDLVIENSRLSPSGDLKLEAQNLTLKDNNGAESLETNQNLTAQVLGELNLTNSRLRSSRNLTLQAQNITVSGDSNIQANGDLNLNTQNDINIQNAKLRTSGNLAIQAQRDIKADNSQLRSDGNLKIESQRNVALTADQMFSLKEIELGAQGTVSVQDSSANPFVARSLGKLTIQGNQAIDIKTLNSSQSVLRSGSDLSLVSDGLITGDGRFASGGNFSALNSSGTPGSLNYRSASSDGIISSQGNVTFGDYTGPSLKIEAMGSITGGSIKITQQNTSLSSLATDPDVAILSKNPAVILRAGLTELRNPFGVPSSQEIQNSPASVPRETILAGQKFSYRTASLPGTITVGDIEVNTSTAPGDDAVILAAPGSIKTGAINTNGGSVTLVSTGGNITVDTINTRESGQGGGGIDISAYGLFRATGSFPFKYQEKSPAFVTSATSILTGTVGTGSDVYSNLLDGNIKIQQGGVSFVENYAPGNVPDNVSGTAGHILIADGSNASLVPSFQDRIFITSLGTNNPKPKDGTTGTGVSTVVGAGGSTGSATGTSVTGTSVTAVNGTGGAMDTGANGGGGITAQAASVVQQRLNTPNNNSACPPSDTNLVAIRASTRAPEAHRQASKTPTSAEPCSPPAATVSTFKLIDNKLNQRQQPKTSSRLPNQRPSKPEAENAPTFSKRFKN